MHYTTRFVACLLCALLALSPAALAEFSVEPSSAYLKISDLWMDANGIEADMGGLCIEIGAAVDDEATLYATVDALDATLSGAVAVGEEGFSFALDGFSKRYVLPMAQLLEASGMKEEDLQQIFSAYSGNGLVSSIDLDAYTQRIESYTTDLAAQLEALNAQAVTFEDFEFDMYDGEHTCTSVMTTIPTEVLHDAVMDGYAIFSDMMEEMAQTMENMGADVSMTQIGPEEMEALFANEPYVEIDVVTTEDSDELLSYIFTFYDSPEDETPVYFYLDLYTPADGFAAYAVTDGGSDGSEVLEINFAAYDDNSATFQIAMTEDGEQAGYFSYETGVDESGEFVIHNVSLGSATDSLDFHYNTDNKTSRYVILQATTMGETVSAELDMTIEADAPAYKEVGTLVLSAADGTLSAKIEYGSPASLPAIVGADMETVSLDAMDEATMAALSMETMGVLSSFAADAIENLPWLADIINNMSMDGPLTGSAETVEVEPVTNDNVSVG